MAAFQSFGATTEYDRSGQPMNTSTVQPMTSPLHECRSGSSPFGRAARLVEELRSNGGAKSPESHCVLGFIGINRFDTEWRRPGLHPRADREGQLASAERCQAAT
jgi:hypothetical protein